MLQVLKSQILVVKYSNILILKYRNKELRRFRTFDVSLFQIEVFDFSALWTVALLRPGRPTVRIW